MYKWKPNAAQRAEYAAKMREREAIAPKGAIGAIRKGCKLKLFHLASGRIVSGEVVNHSYGAEKGQHTFTIDTGSGKIIIKGRNLYPNVIEHIKGTESINTG